MRDPYTLLGRQLIGAAERLDGAGRATPGLRSWLTRHVRALAVSAAVVLSGGAVALAASGVLSGAPVVPERPPRPTVGNGVPVRGADTRIIETVPDPAGGLRWGLRVFHTTRGEVCIEVGRVQDGQLGVIGEDSVFSNDGRFHDLPADALPPGFGGAWSQVECTAEDRTTLFEDANADRNAANDLPEEFGPPGKRRVPPMSHRRALAYGMLGPHAVSVTYRTPSGLRTVPVHGSEGAFVIVQRAGFYRNSSLVGGSVGGRAGAHSVMVLSPPGPSGFAMVSAATFRFGHTLCSVGSGAAVSRKCPRRPVFLPQRWFQPTQNLNRHVDLRLIAQSRAACKRAFLLSPCYAGEVTFTAPYAVTQAGADYEILGKAHCPVGGRPETGSSLERDVRGGERVRTVVLGLFVYTQKCARDESFTVTYLNPQGPSRTAPHESVIVGKVRLSEATGRSR